MDTELDLGIWDSIKAFIDERDLDQISTAALAFADAVIQTTSIVQRTQVKLRRKQAETKQAVTDAATNHTHPIDPSNVEQIAGEQQGIQQLDHGAAQDL